MLNRVKGNGDYARRLHLCNALQPYDENSILPSLNLPVEKELRSRAVYEIKCVVVVYNAAYVGQTGT